jgi:hypothetical protein
MEYAILNGYIITDCGLNLLGVWRLLINIVKVKIVLEFDPDTTIFFLTELKNQISE